uniref:30S ribosomal protein S5, chloroplastic n=1 Tax=Pterocladiophila hemisphaerica TaxID=2712948 RepID=A0A6M3WWJ7_9FLOR|nr:ribosomal protein S5 [Pterocladiophila hemisphaerica]
MQLLDHKIWQEKVVEIKKVTKVIKGGKKLKFKTIVVVGNKKGLVGLGLGKSHDVMQSIQKAILNAQKSRISTIITETYSIPHTIEGHFNTAKVIIKPNYPGSGVIAGSITRVILELAGFKNISSKQIKSTNKLNTGKATLNALELLPKLKKITHFNHSERK